jgi:CheY-like chemotaxis protein
VPDETKRSRQSILIVEDDPFTRDVLVMLLSDLGYDTVPVATVADGLEKLDGQSCAILDLNLPDGLGTHVLKRIRDERRPIRVAVATGSTNMTLLDEAERLGATFFQKPVNVNALIEWLEGERAAAAD